jgi:hypothetical protein
MIRDRLGTVNIPDFLFEKVKDYVPPTPTYPVRHRALGKTKTVKQGVGGWRTNYHRPDTVELAPAKIITITYDDV